MSHFNVYGRMRLRSVERPKNVVNTAEPPFPAFALRVRDFCFGFMDSFSKINKIIIVNTIAGLHYALSEIFANFLRRFLVGYIVVLIKFLWYLR